ncbi:MAG: DUF262 domain-containing protein [Candidatus Aminicenantes bacterium]|nr:DUF262 domain-containing protein [Candidatus Aminicenantes bacterium]
MKATEARLLDFMKKSPQFIIPIYQRNYSWAEPECRQLWDDILRTGQNDEISGHFIGSIVYIERGLYRVTSQEPLLVIDGQQRLTAVSLIIEAIARHIGEDEPIDGFSARKLRNYYLLNIEEQGERRYKLLLTQTDKQSLLALVQQKSLPAEYSLRVKETFDLFETWVKELDGKLAPLCKGLAKLLIVDISLTRDQDNPQLIFESMNSTGRELTQADMIRNFVLMGMEPNQQDQLYNDHWRPMEVAFGQEAYGEHFDAFIRQYLTLKTGEIPNVRKVYEEFKIYAGRMDIDVLVADIHKYADYYCAMALGKETNRTLKAAFKDLRELKVDVAYPFLLELYHDYASRRLSVDDFEYAVRLVESYIFRRAVCAMPTNSLNKIFAKFNRYLNKDRYLESIQAYFQLLPSYRRFPGSDEFQRELMVRDLYNFRSRSYWLRRFENHDRKEQVMVDEYTIEHILPQNENLSRKWQDDLGPDWQRVQETWLHTLGNLTLTGYNSDYRDLPFVEKRDMKGGFKESPLRVNEGLGMVDTWNEDAIKTRAEGLAKKAVHIWRAPSLSAEVLNSYRSKEVKVQGYAIDDYRHLAENSPMRPLFDALRTNILAIDPCVNEEFLKFYVAYKAETNFVDVVPQAKRLILYLNMKFHELYDPKGLAKDVTNISCWGNGDVEVGISSSDELPYVMSLVGQAFEKQMGNGTD